MAKVDGLTMARACSRVPIRIKIWEPSGVTRFLYQTRDGGWQLVTSGGVPVSLNFIVAQDDVMPLKFALEDAGGNDALAVEAVRRFVPSVYKVELYVA